MSEYLEEKPITLAGTVAAMRTYYRILLKRWYVVLLIGALSEGFFLYRAFKEKPTFKADLTFMLNDNSGQGSGQLGFLLGQFGFGGGQDMNYDKIVELSKSHRILNSALFAKATVDGKEDFFANHFITYLDLPKKWAKDTTGLNGFRFSHGNFDTFSRLENRALTAIFKRLTDKKKPLFTCEYSKTSSIFKMGVETENEDLSVFFVRKIFENLSEFYVLKSTERERATYEVIKSQKDSIYGVMRSKAQGAAQFNDYNRGIILDSYKDRGIQMQKDAQIATVAYGEALKQFALADFALKNNTPFIQPVDMPIQPIEAQVPSKILALIYGALVGGLLSVGGILFANALKKALKATSEMS